MQALPGSQYLRRLRNVPPPLQLPSMQPVPDAEQLQHMKCCASSQPLPVLVEPVQLPRTATGACEVCQSDIEVEHGTSSVRLLGCARCGATVHNTCYDARAYEPGSAWLCEPCSAGITDPPACALCPVLGGAMRLCQDGSWVHAACAVWVPGALVVPAGPDISAVRLYNWLVRLLLYFWQSMRAVCSIHTAC